MSKPGPSGPYEQPPPYSPQGQQAPIGFSAPYPPPQYNATSSTTTINYAQPHPGSSTVHVVQAQPTVQQAYVVPVAASGVCPACRVGVLTNEFTCCGIFLAIFLFPFGFICCFMMMERRCTNCRAVYG